MSTRLARSAFSDAREWPKNSNKLSNQLRRSVKALAAVGVDCILDIDNRPVGSQRDLIIERGDKWDDFQ